MSRFSRFLVVLPNYCKFLTLTFSFWTYLLAEQKQFANELLPVYCTLS